LRPRPALQWSPGAAGPLLARDWRDAAACLSVDPDLFFPEDGVSARPAKRVCAGCKVRGECLEQALAAGERHGVWGGLTPRDRALLGRPRRGPAPPAAEPSRAPLVIPDLTRAELARFQAALAPGGCGTTWAGAVNDRGQGQFTVRRGGVAVHVRAHRLAWKLATGGDPAGLVVRRECGQPLCCTPGCLATSASRTAVAA